MSELASQLVLSMGKHASVTDFSATPSLVHLLPEKWGFHPPSRVPLERNPAHPQNKRFAPVAGPIDLSKAQELELIIRGLSGENGGAIDPETTNDIAKILDVVFGTDSIDPAGAATTSTGGGSGTKTVGVTEQARFPVGTVIGVTTDAGIEVVQVRARAGSSGAGNLTVDRNVVGAVTNLATVLRFARWKEDPTIHEHTHAFFRAEWANDRRDWKGGMSRATFDFTVGQYARLITSWMFTDCADAAEADPTFTEQTTGSALVNVNSKFWIGDVAFYGTEMKLELGGTMSERPANSGPQGRQGFKVGKGATAPKPRFSVRLQRGTRTGEVADSTGTPSLNALQAIDLALGAGYGSLDIAAQVGGAAAGLGYVVLPNAACVEANEVVADGYKAIDCVFEANGPTDTTLGPVELHLG